jgi:hypothetical protein
MTQTLLNYPSDTNRLGFQAAPASQLNASQAALNAAIKNLSDAITAAQATLATLNSAATDPNISSDGNGHLSTVGLTTVNNAPATFPHCFLFDGSTYATASAAALNGWTEQTIAFWMWSPDASANATDARVVEKGANSEWTIVLNALAEDGKIFVQELGGTDEKVSSLASVCDGVWHLVVVTIDNTGHIAMYVDNVSQGSYASSLPSPTTGALNIGQYGGGGGYNFARQPDAVNGFGWVNNIGRVARDEELERIRHSDYLAKA